MGAPAYRATLAAARRVGTAVGLIAVVSLLCACGSNQVTGKLVADTTTTETKTVTEPARTITAPARTETVTKTETKTEPGRTTTIHNNTTTVAVKPTTSEGSGGGISSWGWVLIGAGAVVLVVAIFMLGRSHGARSRDATGAPPARGGPYDAGMPPGGPPEDRI